MKKRLSLLLVIFLLTISAFVLAESFVMNEENLLSEQGPVWFYRFYAEETDEILDLTLAPDWGDNWQVSAQPKVDGIYHCLLEWDGVQAMPGKWLGSHIDIVLVFVAPKDGKALLERMNFVIKDDSNEWSPYLVQVHYISGENEPVKLLGEGEDFVQTPYMTDAIEIELKANDELRFIVRSSDNGGAAVSLQPTITYVE